MHSAQSEHSTHIRPATPADLDAIKVIADANRAHLGFVLRPALAEGLARGWLYVATRQATLIGFVHFRVRRDGWVTIYEICTAEAFRCQGVGRALLTATYALAQAQRGLRLKCPVGSTANQFYAELGLCRVGEEQGKRRALAVWQWGK